MTQLVSFNDAAPTPWPSRLWVDDDARPGRKRLLTGSGVTEAAIVSAGGRLVDAAPTPTVRQLPAVWNGASDWSLPDKPVATRKAEMKAAVTSEHDNRAPVSQEVNGATQAIEPASAAAFVVRRTSLYVAVDAAADHDALDLVDTSSGWPTAIYRSPAAQAGRAQYDDTLERRAVKLDRAGDGLGALKLRLQQET